MQVVVCHVHAARIDYLAVDDGYLVVIAVEQVVDPGEADGVEGCYLYASLADACLQRVGEGEVAALVAEAVEDDAYIYSLLCLALELLEQLAADAVLLELEVVQQDVLLGLLDGLEEVAELNLCRWQDAHLAGFIHGNPHSQEVALGTLR